MSTSTPLIAATWQRLRKTRAAFVAAREESRLAQAEYLAAKPSEEESRRIRVRDSEIALNKLRKDLDRTSLDYFTAVRVAERRVA